MYKLINGSDIVAESETPIAYVHAQYGWQVDSVIFVDPEKVLSVMAPAPKVSPVEFKLLFSAQERVAIKVARATDPVVNDFFEIVEDPRLSHVNLGLQSTQNALFYLESKALITANRRMQILTGQVQ